MNDQRGKSSSEYSERRRLPEEIHRMVRMNPAPYTGVDQTRYKIPRYAKAFPCEKCEVKVYRVITRCGRKLFICTDGCVHICRGKTDGSSQ